MSPVRSVLRPLAGATSRTRTLLLLAAWVVGVCVMAASVADTQRQSREALQERFGARVDTATRFVRAYKTQTLEAELRIAQVHLTGERVGRAEFQNAVSRIGMSAAMLVDDRGRALHATAQGTRLVGRDVARHRPHLRSALSGRASVSEVMRFAASGRRTVGFAVPFDTPRGRRVFSVAYDPDRTPLGSYLASALPLEGGRVVLVDRQGRVVAANGPRDAARVEARLPAGWRGDLPGARYADARPVAGTPWRIAMSVPHHVLYAPVTGRAHWGPWAVLAGLAAAALAAALLLGHVLSTRRLLARSETRHRAILRSLPDAAVLLFDHDLRYLSAEGPGLAAVGWTAEELVGRTPSEALPVDQAQMLEPLYRSALAGEVTRTEVRSRRAPRDFAVEFAPLYGADGAIEGGMAVARDITERRRAEVHTAEAEERFRLAFDQAPIGIAMLSLDGLWLRVNDALCRMLVRTRDELLGSTFADVTHPADLDADAADARRCLSGEIERYEIERRFLTATGDEVRAFVSVSLVRDASRRPLYFLAQAVDVTERRRAEDQLAYFASHDPLTGLVNRRRFDEELERQLAHGARYGRPASLLMIDLDRFKDVNDRFGHAAGDDLIVRVAGALRERLRTTDVIARLGGDEFAALLPETGVEDAERVAGDLVELVGRLGVIEVGGCSVEVTASIGVTAVDPGRQTAQQVLLEADAALYAAKDAGRATVAVHALAST